VVSDLFLLIPRSLEALLRGAGSFLRSLLNGTTDLLGGLVKIAFSALGVLLLIGVGLALIFTPSSDVVLVVPADDLGDHMERLRSRWRDTKQSMGHRWRDFTDSCKGYFGGGAGEVQPTTADTKKKKEITTVSPPLSSSSPHSSWSCQVVDSSGHRTDLFPPALVLSRTRVRGSTGTLSSCFYPPKDKPSLAIVISDDNKVLEVRSLRITLVGSAAAAATAGSTTTSSPPPPSQLKVEIENMDGSVVDIADKNKRMSWFKRSIVSIIPWINSTATARQINVYPPPGQATVACLRDGNKQLVSFRALHIDV
jgi:hypothetical protein